MTKIKLCGLSRMCDIEMANELNPEYIGFVFAAKSIRYVSEEKAYELKSRLSPKIKSVGVFVREAPEKAAELLNRGIIDIAQLHGGESEEYIKKLRELSDKPIIKAFRIASKNDIEEVNSTSADYILLDSGAGSGTVFDWNLIKNIERPYFLAGGLCTENVSSAVKTLNPYAVDVSSGIETDGVKDRLKAAAFVSAVRSKE